MNTENEKKWFVYIGDHHEGPLSVSEVFDRKQQGQVTLESYVWCEGMADWLMLHQVPALEGELTALAPARPLESEPATPAAAVSETAETARAPEPEPQKTSSVETLAPKVQSRVSVARDEPVKRSGAARGIAIAAILLVLLLIGGLIGVSRTSNPALHARFRPFLESVTSKAPFLKSAIKLIPRLTDVKPAELEALDRARSAAPGSQGSLALALSTTDPNRPAFYLSGNLPHGTQVTLLAIGVPETLLNRLQFKGQWTTTLSHGFARTEALLMEGAQPLPKGEYEIFAFDSAEQPDAAVRSALAALGAPAQDRGKSSLPAEVPQSFRVLATGKFFIGGERDQTYLTRLKAFHENIRQKAEKELGELHQYAETLILQHNSLTSQFQKIYRAKKIAPALRASWKRDSQAWLQISGQLDQTIQTWSKETLQNEFFYGKAYELVKSAFQSMRSLFQLEIDFVEKGLDRNAFEIQHGKLLSEARESLDLMRTKTEALFKMPKTQSGLPSREGL